MAIKKRIECSLWIGLLFRRFAALRSGLRRKEGILCLAYPALTPAARLPPQHAKTARAGDPGVARLGPCWAKLATRLTALRVGVVRGNAREEFFPEVFLKFWLLRHAAEQANA
jgi:hypothetical protein